MKTFCIVPAAGVGKRMGGKLPKQYLLLQNQPIILHTLMALEKAKAIDEIYLVTGGEVPESFSQSLKEMGIKKLSGFVTGGKERQESVYNGLKALPAQKDDMVIIHDGVRPFVTESIIDNCLREAMKTGGAIAAIPVTDTLKQVRNGKICGSVDRSLCYRVQTPQCFRYGTIFRAYRDAKGFYTDDSSIAEAMGVEVGVVPGDESNIKITTPFDLILAQSILRNKC